MDIFEDRVEELIQREGGYSHHPDDRGGKTCWGITEAVARAAGYKGDMAQMPKQVATTIYRERYWAQPGFDRVADLSPGIATELLDTGVNMGPSVASGFLQRTLNALNRQEQDWPDLAVDHRIGERTLAALAQFLKRRGTPGERVLMSALNGLQTERYIRLSEQRPANEAFTYGWLAHRIGRA